MKDKLVKTGHKKAYYKVKSFFILLALIFGFGIATAGPVLVAKQITEIRNAEEEETSISVSEESSESNTDVLESDF